MLILSTSYALAYDNGDTISYRGRRVEDSDGTEIAVFTVVGDSSWTGTCAQAGTSLASSGSGDIETVGKNSKARKLLYKYAIEEGWWDGSAANDSAAGILNRPGTSTKKKHLVEAIAQIYHMGKSDYRAGATIHNAEGLVDAILDWYDSLDTSDITVPNNFEVYFVNCGNAQDFVIWRMAPEPAKCKIKKSSKYTNITGS